MKHLGKPSPELDCCKRPQGSDWEPTECCSWGEYCCTTEKQKHYRQTLIELDKELEKLQEEEYHRNPTGKLHTDIGVLRAKICISAGQGDKHDKE